MQLGAPDAYAPGELEDARAFFAALAARSAAVNGADRRTSPPCWRTSSAPARLTPRNPVQVMTIHRAKGLEFEHVFVPALERLTRAGERRAAALDRPARRDGGPSELLIAPAPAVGPQEEAGNSMPSSPGCSARARAHERKRLLYVAVTRARAHAVALRGARRWMPRARVRPAGHSLLGALWPALAERFELEAPAAAAPRAATRRADAPACARGRRRRCPPAVPLAAPAGGAPAQRAAGVQLGGRDAASRRHAGARLARAPGAPGAPRPDAAALERERAAGAAQLRRLGVPERDEARAAQRDPAARSPRRSPMSAAAGSWILRTARRTRSSRSPG